MAPPLQVRAPAAPDGKISPIDDRENKIVDHH